MPQQQEEWTPAGPYRLKSGQHAGQTLEQILLHNIIDFLKMKWALERNASNPLHLNGYQRHFQWLIAKFDQLAATALCRECGQPAKILPAVGSSQEGYHFVPQPLCPACCAKSQWQRASTVSLSLRAPENFRSQSDKKRAWEAIKAALGFPKKITGQQLFELLAAINHHGPV